MTILKKELRQSRVSLPVWTVLLSAMLAMVILIYPEMKDQMTGMSDSFSQMGQFSQAFGMDRLDFGRFQDYFAIEFGNIMGLLGALYASMLGIRSLSSEESGHTAEFLLTHPITRSRVAGEKLLALAVQITLLNLTVALVCFGLTAAIGEEIDEGRVALLFFSNYLMHLELAGITFGLSAFLRRNGFAVGMGIGAGAYFLNILSNLMEELEFLKYLTPMGYTDGAQILCEGTMDAGYLLSGLLLLALSLIAGFRHYSRKDIS